MKIIKKSEYLINKVYNSRLFNSLKKKDIEWAYRTILDRDAESSEAIKWQIKTAKNVKQLVENIIKSDESKLKESNLSQEVIMRKNGFLPITETSENDIFVCAWPKSGNTWSQRLISGIFFGIDTAVLTDQLAQTLQPDVHFKHFYERFGPTMIWKSHNLPQSNYRKVIHLVRDGRDAILSYWHMMRRAEPNLTLEGMFESGDSLWPSTWEKHSSEWIKNPFGAEIMTVRYEDLLNDPLPQLKAVANFIGRPRKDERLMEIYNGACIENMRRIADEYGWANQNSILTKNFMRRGESGAWKDEMPKEIIEKFNMRAGYMLQHFKYNI